MLLPLAYLVYSTFAIPFGIPSPAAILAPQIGAVDSLPPMSVDIEKTTLVTMDALTRMITFWAAFKKEPQTVRDTDSHRVVLQQISVIGRPFVFETRQVNMVVLAAMYPSVAADFKQAGLTPHQWEAWKVALFAAVSEKEVVDSGYALPPRSTSVAAHNIALLQAHPKELHALREIEYLDLKEQPIAREDTKDAH